MRNVHIKQHNDWAMASPLEGAMQWHDVLSNGPVGPPCKNKFLEYLFSGLEPPWKGYKQQPVVFRAWLLWFGEQWK